MFCQAWLLITEPSIWDDPPTQHNPAHVRPRNLLEKIADASRADAHEHLFKLRTRGLEQNERRETTIVTQHQWVFPIHETLVGQLWVYHGL